MAEETLLERLIPGDLEKTVPAKLKQALPGGFRNRFVQIGLGLMISLGLAFLVRRWLAKREAQRVIASPQPAPRHRRPAGGIDACAGTLAAPVGCGGHDRYP